MKKETYLPQYWNGTGKYQELYEELFQNLVPKEGNAPSNLGEMLRITSKLYYDIFNNGGWNFSMMKEWRIKLVRLCPASMKKSAEKFIRVPKKGQTENEDYLRFLDAFVDWVINYIDAQLKLQELEKEAK